MSSRRVVLGMYRLEDAEAGPLAILALIFQRAGERRDVREILFGEKLRRTPVAG